MEKKIRVLQVVTNLDVGGIEKLVHDLSLHINKQKFEIDICCVGGASGPLLNSVKEAGISVFSFGHYRKHPMAFFRGYHELLRKKKYNIIHSHLNHFSWLFLRYSWLHDKKTLRIGHYHNDFSGKFLGDSDSRLKKNIRSISRRLTDRYAECIVGISDAVLRSVYGGELHEDKNIVRLYNGVSLESFSHSSVRRNKNRLELRIAPDAFVIGHVGRFRPQKNHELLLSLASRLCVEVPNCLFLLVGDGPLLGGMKKQVQSRGLQDRFIFTGACTNIADLLCCMDVFVFPSLWEGFGLALVEAQAAGVPALVSEHVSKEVPVVPPSKVLSLERIDPWVESCVEFFHMKINRSDITQSMQAQLTDFSLSIWIGKIEQLYLDGIRENSIV